MVKLRVSLCSLAFLLCVLHVSSQRSTISSRRKSEQTVLQNILNANSYDNRVNPGGQAPDSPVEVEVQIYTRDIFEVDSVNNELKVQFTLRQKWNDSRLSYNSRVGSDELKYVTLLDVSKIWRPDIFVSNSKEEKLHDYSRPNTFARIFPSGEVLLSERLSLTVTCNMNWRAFPFDRQTCKIRLASYSFTTSDIKLRWNDTEPLKVKPELGMESFTLSSFSTDRCDAETTTGTYSCIMAIFEFQRESKHYFVHIFIPCTMLALVAYLVFWLEPKNLLVRVILSLATLYVAATQISRFNESNRKSNYTKAVDNFTGVCLTFIFVTLIETVIVYNLARKEESEPASQESNEEAPQDPEAENLKPEAEGAGEAPKKKVKKFNARNMRKYLTGIQKRSDRVDFIFRILYPVLLTVFYLVFFLVAAL